ncbi:glycosyl hydrolase family 18 [bacterium]|nr:glycosyl hydrolase family 18 [bacterium]
MKRSGRKLSILRLIIALSILFITGYGVHSEWERWKDNRIIGENAKPWFAAYVDITATPRYDFEQSTPVKAQNLVLSFIVSSENDACIPSWGKVYTLEKAGTQLDLDRRIARLRQQGGNIAISFGGQINDELSIKCTDDSKLLTAYTTVVEKYQVNTIDLDIEGESMKNMPSIIRRAEVMAKLQENRKKDRKNLAIWITLPVTPQGLTPEGTTLIAQMLKAKVDIAGVNIMTMNYGESKQKHDSMFEASKSALLETHRQLGILYSQAGIKLTSASIWAKLGATPMIGQNDLSTEVFLLKDALNLNKYAKAQGILRLSMWSINRDIQCGENYVNLAIVSDSCSGVEQSKFDYTTALSASFTGDLNSNAGKTTTNDTAQEEEILDFPENSPYPIWNENSTYFEGTKIVWHRTVYQAKWWTQGDLPDNPVLQSWQTPWKLIGPVLPGEKPLKLPTLSKDTFKEWSGKKQYNTGDMVLFEGTPYRAKWWSQGDSPAASTENSAGSPWIALSQEEIEVILKNSKK